MIHAYVKTPPRRLSAAMAAAVVVALCGIVGISLPAYASTDAYFSLSPSSNTVSVGSTFTVTVSETSYTSDNTNAVQANLAYNKALLQYVGTSLSAFTICTQNSGGSGSVNIACAASSALNGEQTVATVTFRVLASSTATIKLATGSDIVNTGGQSVWNSVLPSSTFTLSTASAPSGSGSKLTSGSSPSSDSGSASASASAPPAAGVSSTGDDAYSPNKAANKAAMNWGIIIGSILIALGVGVTVWLFRNKSHRGSTFR